MSTATTIEPRMTTPVAVIPELLTALHRTSKALKDKGVPIETAYMVHLRASQINGCSFCVDMHSKELKDAGVSDEKIWGVGAWREAPFFTEAERAALALTEAATRLADQAEAVSDEVFDEAARHYDEEALAALIGEIAVINVWNRLNVTIRQPAGAWSA